MDLDFSYFFIGINHQFSIEEDFNLKQGDVRKFENYSLTFETLKLEKKNNYKAVIGKFNILDLKKGTYQTLLPEIRVYSQPETLTYESSIRSRLAYDLYLTMSNINRSEFYNIKFQKKPFMIWIWISSFLIAFGGTLRFFKNEN